MIGRRTKGCAAAVQSTQIFIVGDPNDESPAEVHAVAIELRRGSVLACRRLRDLFPAVLKWASLPRASNQKGAPQRYRNSRQQAPKHCRDDPARTLRDVVAGPEREAASAPPPGDRRRSVFRGFRQRSFPFARSELSLLRQGLGAGRGPLPGPSVPSRAVRRSVRRLRSIRMRRRIAMQIVIFWAWRLYQPLTRSIASSNHCSSDSSVSSCRPPDPGSGRRETFSCVSTTSLCPALELGSERLREVARGDVGGAAFRGRQTSGSATAAALGVLVADRVRFGSAGAERSL